jgi:hypothetical protein
VIGRTGFDRHAMGYGFGGRRMLHDSSLGDFCWLARREEWRCGGAADDACLLFLGEWWTDGEIMATWRGLSRCHLSSGRAMASLDVSATWLWKFSKVRFLLRGFCLVIALRC